MDNLSLSKFHAFDNHRLLASYPPKHHVGPQICVICMASYELGLLHGEWIDATLATDTILCQINEMLARSPATNANIWAIYAYCGFGNLILPEMASLDSIQQKALFISTYGEWSLELLHYFNQDIDTAEEAIVEHYQGKYLSELAFATHLLNTASKNAIPKFLQIYIDYESFRKEIFRRDYFSIGKEGEVHVFSRCRE